MTAGFRRGRSDRGSPRLADAGTTCGLRRADGQGRRRTGTSRRRSVRRRSPPWPTASPSDPCAGRAGEFVFGSETQGVMLSEAADRLDVVGRAHGLADPTEQGPVQGSAQEPVRQPRRRQPPPMAPAGTAAVDRARQIDIERAARDAARQSVSRRAPARQSCSRGSPPDRRRRSKRSAPTSRPTDSPAGPTSCTASTGSPTTSAPARSAAMAGAVVEWDIVHAAPSGRWRPPTTTPVAVWFDGGERWVDRTDRRAGGRRRGVGARLPRSSGRRSRAHASASPGRWPSAASAARRRRVEPHDHPRHRRSRLPPAGRGCGRRRPDEAVAARSPCPPERPRGDPPRGAELAGGGQGGPSDEPPAPTPSPRRSPTCRAAAQELIRMYLEIVGVCPEGRVHGGASPRTASATMDGRSSRRRAGSMSTHDQ